MPSPKTSEAHSRRTDDDREPRERRLDVREAAGEASVRLERTSGRNGPTSSHGRQARTTSRRVRACVSAPAGARFRACERPLRAKVARLPACRRRRRAGEPPSPPGERRGEACRRRGQKMDTWTTWRAVRSSPCRRRNRACRPCLREAALAGRKIVAHSRPDVRLQDARVPHEASCRADGEVPEPHAPGRARTKVSRRRRKLAAVRSRGADGVRGVDGVRRIIGAGRAPRAIVGSPPRPRGRCRASVAWSGADPPR